MSVPDFADRMRAAQTARGSTLAIALAPALDKIPYPLQQHDDPFLPYGRAVIDATADITCAYIFDLAAYLSVGASGAVALERTIVYVPSPSMNILHGPFTRAEYAPLVTNMAFTADAATLATTDPNVIAAFIAESGRGVFIESDTLSILPQGQYPDQVGAYRVGDSLVLAGNPADTAVRWHWAGEEVALASRGADFQDAVRAAALKYQNMPPRF